MRVHLKALGCRLNEAELESWARQWQSLGYRIVADTDQADLVVLNSCAVTGDAVRKSRQLVRKAAREHPRAKLVLSGCYGTLNRAEAEALGVDLIVANADKHHLVSIAQRELELPAAPEAAPSQAVWVRLGRHRAFIKVQDGCRHRCTYCIVTVARGEERSRDPSAIIDEINAAHAEGIQEVVLTGVHLGGYGNEWGTDLSDLLTRILAETTIPRLRLGSLEPWDIPESLPDLFENRRLMPHLHLPLQSGSDRVLKRMARRCRTAHFARLMARLRRAVPDINITTDIIVGFPGETETEWAESLAFVERMQFGGLHVFPFSPRAGTVAAGLPNPVPDGVKQARSRVLRQLAERLKQQTLRAFLGRECPVLWEGLRPGPNGKNQLFGYTPHYLKVAMAVDGDPGLSYRISEVRLVRLAEDGDYLVALPVDRASARHPSRT
ncbi:tRNA (N(6)-L-threonylcarbamoyladenosine(37)-C(2))-methylthiotransferase MtaB [Candidatus Methylocalor cossyra]|uniref:MiaB family protein, possibly involved in tRNA or rRNA modification n=1 Tax=Candidatus Methylocalor cossyra TaxID=3108543 RepID=A0ABM9NJF9_9GAMM